MSRGFLRRNLPLVTIIFCVVFWLFQWWLHSDLVSRFEVLKQNEAKVANLEDLVKRSTQREKELSDLLTRLHGLELGPLDRTSFKEHLSKLADQWGLTAPSATSWPSTPSNHVVITRQGDFIDLCHWFREISIQSPVGHVLSLEIFEVAEEPGSVLCRLTFDDQSFGGRQ